MNNVSNKTLESLGYDVEKEMKKMENEMEHTYDELTGVALLKCIDGNHVINTRQGVNIKSLRKDEHIMHTLSFPGPVMCQCAQASQKASLRVMQNCIEYGRSLAEEEANAWFKASWNSCFPNVPAPKFELKKLKMKDEDESLRSELQSQINKDLQPFVGKTATSAVIQEVVDVTQRSIDTFKAAWDGYEEAKRELAESELSLSSHISGCGTEIAQPCNCVSPKNLHQGDDGKIYFGRSMGKSTTMAAKCLNSLTTVDGDYFPDYKHVPFETVGTRKVTYKDGGPMLPRKHELDEILDSANKLEKSDKQKELEFFASDCRRKK